MWINELCRLCAQVSELLFPIYEKNGDKARLDLKIKKLLSITIDENDQKPKNICYSCCNKLEELNEFMEICQNSDYKFESIIFNASQTENQNVQTIVDNRKIILEQNKGLILHQPKWENEKLTQAIEPGQLMEHNGVIVVQKVNDNQNLNRECQDILLMVELKYKEDLELNSQSNQPQNSLPNPNNKIVYQSSENQIYSSVLRHSSDDFAKLTDNNHENSTNQKLNLDSLEYTTHNTDSSSNDFVDCEPIELIKATNVIQENKSVDRANVNIKLKPFPCNECDKSFMRRSNLNAHMSTHTMVKPYQCDQCDRSFGVRWNLTVHQRIHSGLYSCEFCGKAFPVKGKLERHRRTHTGEKPFICPVPNCEKAFADKRNLEAHNRIHTQERPYVCQICSRCFGSKSHMIDHQKVHSKEAAYTCESCGKSFKWKTNLTLHMKAHNGEKCICMDCGKSFARKAQLNKHRKCCHNEVIVGT